MADYTPRYDFATVEMCTEHLSRGFPGILIQQPLASRFTFSGTRVWLFAWWRWQHSPAGPWGTISDMCMCTYLLSLIEFFRLLVTVTLPMSLTLTIRPMGILLPLTLTNCHPTPPIPYSWTLWSLIRMLHGTPRNSRMPHSSCLQIHLHIIHLSGRTSSRMQSNILRLPKQQRILFHPSLMMSGCQLWSLSLQLF